MQWHSLKWTDSDLAEGSDDTPYSWRKWSAKRGNLFYDQHGLTERSSRKESIRRLPEKLITYLWSIGLWSPWANWTITEGVLLQWSTRGSLLVSFFSELSAEAACLYIRLRQIFQSNVKKCKHEVVLWEYDRPSFITKGDHANYLLMSANPQFFVINPQISPDP
jgi:hypothetical protein